MNQTLFHDHWTAIVLAAGQGTRMKSPLPKVLHPVAGRPMIVRVVEQLKKADFGEIRVVIHPHHSLVRTVVQALNVSIFEQPESKGTGHAVLHSGLESLEGSVVITNGDHPLVDAEDFKNFCQSFKENQWDLAVVTTTLKKPGSFGRIVRQLGQIRAIVEAKEASHQTLAIKEVNTGLYCVKASVLKDLVPLLKSQNRAGEFYLTDMVELAIERGLKVGTLPAKSRVAFGVNTQMELAKASKYVYQKKCQQLMEQGVLVLDPESTYIEETVQIEPGTAIYPNVFIRGRTKIGPYCSLEPNCFVVDSILDSSVHVKAGSYLERVKIQSEAQIGPYARLRPETEIGKGAQVGNFVEMKKVKFGAGSKANHLTYLGDAEVGEGTNVGCGTITCNYAVDRKKYKTIIGNHVFVGSDSQLVAPVTVGDHAIIGSGSTITQDVPPYALAVARARQEIKPDWAKRLEALLQQRENKQTSSAEPTQSEKEADAKATEKS